MLNVMNFVTTCPIPLSQYPHVLMAHGGGGKLMHRLLEDVFGKAFSNPILDTRHDSAQFTVPAGQAGDDHGFLRRAADFFPRRRHRFAGGSRHGE